MTRCLFCHRLRFRRNLIATYENVSGAWMLIGYSCKARHGCLKTEGGETIGTGTQEP
jgi:hypothetical protein